MRVCVELTKPAFDILDEYVIVEVTDFPDSVYIPEDATLASESLYIVWMWLILSLFLSHSDPDAPDFMGGYPMAFDTDYAQQTVGVNAIDDQMITELMRVVCYDQPIYDDDCVEEDEWLGLTLAVDDSTVLTNVAPDCDQAAILIRDNDSK